MKTFTLKIENIKFETKDSITLCFKQPGLRKIKYEAGQYITLILRINGRKYARPYSFSSAPSVDSLLEITVKRVPGGIVSNYINDQVKVGDVFEIIEPMGDFIFDSNSTASNLYLWGVGSGITPLFSLTKEILNTKPNLFIHLIYGNKSSESAIFHDQLIKLDNESHQKFSLINFYSKSEDFTEDNNSKKGRINSDFVRSFLLENKSRADSLHYICGPNKVKSSIKNALLDLDIPNSSIYTEEFEINIDPKELENVSDSNINVILEGRCFEYFVPKGETLLDKALDQGLEIPYACQTGNCSTCKGNLISGELKMIGLTKKRDDLADNEFLLCCSFPLTNQVTIKI